MDLIAIVFISGILAGFVSGFAGGGGGIFLAPMLMFFGIPPHVSVATARMGAAGLSVGAFTRFLRSGEIIWQRIIPLILMSVPAAILGAYLVLAIDPLILKKVIGGILMLSAVFFLEKRNIHGGKPVSNLIAYPIFFLARILQAAFGAGVGLLLSVVYVKLMGMSLRQSNATKRLPGMVVIVTSLIIFGSAGVIDYRLGLTLLVGSLIGGFIGAHTSLKVDQKYISYAMFALSLGFGLYLIGWG